MPEQQVEVEFFGIARLRAGKANVTLEVSTAQPRLRDIVRGLAAQFPVLKRECFCGDELAGGYLFSVAGEYFLRDSDQLIDTSKSLILMSADAGG